MKFQTTQTGKSYLLLIERANELMELPRWLLCLDKPIIIIVPKKPPSLPTQVIDAPDKQQNCGIRASRYLERHNEAGEPRTEPLLPLSRRDKPIQFTLSLLRTGFAFIQWENSSLIVTLIVFVLFALLCAGLGLLLLRLGPPLK